MISNKLLFIVKPLTVVGIVTEFNSLYRVFPGSFRRDGEKFLFYGAYVKTMSPTVVTQIGVKVSSEYYHQDFAVDKLLTIILNNGTEIDVLNDILSEDDTKKFINPRNVATICTNNNTIYTIIHITKCDKLSIEFTGSASSNLSGYAQKYSLKHSEIKNLVMDEKTYDIDNVRLKMVGGA